jgi:hypothetical protein
MSLNCRRAQHHAHVYRELIDLIRNTTEMVGHDDSAYQSECGCVPDSAHFESSLGELDAAGDDFQPEDERADRADLPKQGDGV